MVEYIKREDALRFALFCVRNILDSNISLQDKFDEIPSADVAEVRHGKWEVLESFSSPFDDSHKDRCRCTNCGFIHVFTDYHFGQYNFCPNCGAKMDGE